MERRVNNPAMTTSPPMNAMRAQSIAGTHVTTPSRTTKAPTGRACTPHPPPVPVPSPCCSPLGPKPVPTPSPPPPPPATIAAGITSTPSRSIGSPNTRFTVMLSLACESSVCTSMFGLRRFIGVGLSLGDSARGCRRRSAACVVLVGPFLRRRVCPSSGGAEHAGDLGLEVGDGPTAVVALDLVVDFERPYVLDSRTTHLERLAAHPTCLWRREVAHQLGDVDGTGLVE